MKYSIKFLLAGFTLAWTLAIAACETEHSQSQPVEPATTDVVLEEEPGACGQDTTVPKQTAHSWIFDGWQDQYENIGLGMTSEEKPVKYGGFETQHIKDLVDQCPDCPYFYVAYSIPNTASMHPRAIIMNMDANCTVDSTGDTPALLSSVNKRTDDSESGFIPYDSAKKYIANWKALFNASEPVFPAEFEEVHSYTYVRDSVVNAMNDCIFNNPEWTTTLRATYAVHPDTLLGDTHPDSLLMDIIFTCDCAHDDSVKFSGDFVDIANPCPPVCPTY